MTKETIGVGPLLKLPAALEGFHMRRHSARTNLKVELMSRCRNHVALLPDHLILTHVVPHYRPTLPTCRMRRLIARRYIVATNPTSWPPRRQEIESTRYSPPAVYTVWKSPCERMRVLSTFWEIADRSCTEFAPLTPRGTA